MASIFSRIISGELPSHKIAEDDQFIAFLDITPLVPGHTLVVPKIEVDYIFGLDTDTYSGLWSFARTIAPAIQRAIPCKRVGIAVIGLEVLHTHVHLVPLQTVSDINFERIKMHPGHEELAAIAERIRKEL